MNNNAALQKDVQDALKWEPLLHAAEIGVTVNDGVVTLTGFVDNYTKKSEAEHAAKSVKGVKVVIEKIEVKFETIWTKTTDEDIATEVINAFKWNWRVPTDRVKVKVETGWITLDGELEYSYQRDASVNAVKDLLGVKGITNNIQIKSIIMEVAEKATIKEALKRNWAIYDNDIDVEVFGHKATLSGTVESWYQKDEAGRIALNAKGIWSVDNKLIVDYAYSFMNE